MDLSKYTDNFDKGYLLHSDNTADRFHEWTLDLIMLMESRVYSGSFKQLVNFVIGKEDQFVTKLSDDELEEQLIYCSQYKFLLSELAGDIARYQVRIKKKYDSWYAEAYNRAKASILEGQRKEIKDGIRSKANYDKLTKDDVRYYIIEHNKTEYENWLSFIENIEKSGGFVSNLLSDLESRSYILMSVNKRRGKL